MFFRRALSLACLTSAILACFAPSASCDDAQEEYTLFVSADDTKVSLISGNLSIAVTRAWPRVVFWHTMDPFSPTFDIGFSRVYLFNDTDGDGRFSPAETTYTVYLDSGRVVWNLSSVQSDFSPAMGEFAMFHMSTRADAFNASSESIPAVGSWADIRFSFCISEKDTLLETPAGAYSVCGKTELSISMTVEVLNGTGCDAVAVERFLQGGGTTSMFLVLEDGPDEGVSATLSSRVDETLSEDGIPRPLNATDSPVQCVDFSKEDGTVQAFFNWGSRASSVVDGGSNVTQVNSSCYTNGAGLMLHSVVDMVNGSAEFSHVSVLGLMESGFVGRMVDWVKEHTSVFVVLAVLVGTVSVVSLHLVLRRRRSCGKDTDAVHDDKDR